VVIDDPVEEMGRAYMRLDRIFVENVLRSREILGPEQEEHFLQFLERVQRRSGQGHWQPGGLSRPSAGRHRQVLARARGRRKEWPRLSGATTEG
jgi:hypothetical protein